MQHNVGEKPYLTRNQTNALRGVAAVLVIAAHFVQRVNMLQMAPAIPLIGNLGRYGVAVFFACSGYGLVESWKKDANLTGYWGKRLTTVFIPCWLIQVLCYFIIPAADYSYKETILQLTGVTHWYIVVCFFLYLIFYLAAKNKRHIWSMVFLGVSLLNIALLCMAVPDYWYMSNYTFFVGLLWAFYKEKILEKTTGWSIIATAVLFLLSSVVYAKWSYLWPVYFVCKNLSAVFWAVLVLQAVYYVPLRAKILERLGSCSLFLYLIHLNVFDYIAYKDIVSLQVLTAGLCGAVFSAYFLSKIYTFIFRKSSHFFHR